jgi:glucose-6-phosphate isomerase
MKYSEQQLWERFQKYYTEYPQLGLALDLSRMNFGDDFFASMAEHLKQSFQAMAELEKGSCANPDEKRMVGHYWLRNPALAPKAEMTRDIEQTVLSIKEFAAKVHSGGVQGAKGKFDSVLLIGIGGSALGPQFVSKALGQARKDRMTLFFFDNTDPDGIDNTLSSIPDLGRTLSVVISKSGGTKETRNGMLEAEAAYRRAGLNFGQHTVAITSHGSELDKYATQNGWLARFPMWDWVGGRTSELSAVGLLPAALQGLDIDGLLAGAKACDEATRIPDVKANPAAQLALMWYYAGEGRGNRNLIILPYKDRLELFSKYLQQLLMESLGKELDLDGKQVNQGLTVLGNKGSTDQHSYIQQLRDGLNNFFVTFIEVLRDREGSSMEVEPGVTTGDYLEGFFLGTRKALYESDRESMTLIIREVSPFSVGMLIALFERAVGLYARLININAYHQPGVEAGKKAAAEIIKLQHEIVAILKGSPSTAFTVSEIAGGLKASPSVESIFKICEHLAANPDRSIARTAALSPGHIKYSYTGGK